MDCRIVHRFRSSSIKDVALSLMACKRLELCKLFPWVESFAKMASRPLDSLSMPSQVLHSHAMMQGLSAAAWLDHSMLPRVEVWFSTSFLG